MADSEEEYDEFEEQLRLEKAEKERRSRCSDIEHGHTRTDPDGTVYEWDADKMAYFPKIDADFIAQYQMSYGSNTASSEPAPDSDKSADKKADPTSSSTSSATDWTTYFPYVQKYITEHGTYPPEMSKAHQEYYVYLHNYYYGSTEGKTDKKTEGKTEASSESQNDKDKTENSDAKKEDKENEKGKESKEKSTGDEEKSGEGKEETAEEKAYREYYEQYQEYYKAQAGDGAGAEDSEQREFDEWAWYNYYYGGQEGAEGDGEEKEGEEEKGEEKEKGKEEGDKKKRKAEKAGWFEIEQEKNTNVYVSGLPEDVTDDEFKELMNKCGMIMYDPRTQKMKLKLYRDADGKPKGDGLCCYIKSESVDLALQMLDDYDVRGYKISVDVAKFEMKGKFDPKRRKKLSNRERKKMKEQQEKALDWRPDKPIGYRPKHERIIVITNAFDYKEFERDPAKIQSLREELRAQCNNFGMVKKIIVYDRNQLGVVTVAFNEVPEADLARESLHGRFFQRRQITVDAWDGKTKYDVQETEAEKTARLAQWAVYLESAGEGPVPAGERPTEAESAKAGEGGAGKGEKAAGTGVGKAGEGRAEAGETPAGTGASTAGETASTGGPAPFPARPAPSATPAAPGAQDKPESAVTGSGEAGGAGAEAPETGEQGGGQAGGQDTSVPTTGPKDSPPGAVDATTGENTDRCDEGPTLHPQRSPQGQTLEEDQDGGQPMETADTTTTTTDPVTMETQ